MSEIKPSILEKKLIFKKFKLKKLLHDSELSSVYEGKNIIKNTPVAIKIENKNKHKFNFVESEAYTLMNIKGLGFPKIISLGKYGPFNILVEELLGKDIYELWKSGPFKKDIFGKNNIYINDICLLAIQGIERLKYIHNKNIIHRDIKTHNFLIGRNDPNIIYLIDFGFARKYRSSRTGKHIRFSNLKKLIGSMMYSSINANRGYESSRRDDLESFGYMLLYLAKGGWTPWLKYKKIKDKNEGLKKIVKMKLEITNENLCKGLPNEFIQYMKYVKKLDFEQEPDYQYLNSLFISILSKNNMGKNITFFWIKPDSKKGELPDKKSNSIIKALNNKKTRNVSRSNCARRLYRKIKSSLGVNEKVEKNPVDNHRKIITDGNLDYQVEKSETKKNDVSANFNKIINNNQINPKRKVKKLEPKGRINYTIFKTFDNNNNEERKNIITSEKFNLKNTKEEINLKLKDKINRIKKFKKINNNSIELRNNTINYMNNLILCNNLNYNNNQYIINRIPKIPKNNYGLMKINNKVIKKTNNIILNENNLNRDILYKPIFKNI